MRYRVPYPIRAGENPCIYNHTLPTDPTLEPTDPDACPMIGEVLERTLDTLRFMDSNASMEVFRVKNYDGEDSVWSHVSDGTADCSPLYMTLTNERRKLLPNLGQVISDQIIMAYKDPGTLVAEVDIFQLFPEGFLIPFSVTMIMYVMLKGTKYFPWFPERLRRRIGVLLLFWVGIFLSYLGSHVVVVISRHEPPKRPFTDFATLVNKLYWGSYTAITNYDLYYRDFLNRPEEKVLTGQQRSFYQAAKYNPPMLEQDLDKAMALVTSSGFMRKKYVLITDYIVQNDIKARYCDIFFAYDRLETSALTMYFREGADMEAVIKNFTEIHRSIANVAAERIKLKYLKLKWCPTLVNYNDDVTYLHQIQSAFWFLCFGLLACLGFCGGEWLYRKIYVEHRQGWIKLSLRIGLRRAGPSKVEMVVRNDGSAGGGGGGGGQENGRTPKANGALHGDSPNTYTPMAAMDGYGLRDRRTS